MQDTTGDIILDFKDTECVTLVLSDLYSKKGKSVTDYVMEDGIERLEYTTLGSIVFNGSVMMPICMDYLVIKYGLPTNPQRLITSFRRAPESERIRALKYYLAQGRDINVDSSILLRTALQLGYHEVSAFLLESGAEYFRETPDISIEYFTTHLHGDDCSVFNGRVTATDACALVLLKDVLRRKREGALSSKFYDRLLESSQPAGRLLVFTKISVIPEDLIPEVAAFLHFLYTLNPDFTVKSVPACGNLRVYMLSEYGVLYDTYIHATVYTQFQETSAQLKRLSDLSEKLLIK